MTYEPSYCVHLVDQIQYERVACRLPAVAFRRLENPWVLRWTSRESQVFGTTLTTSLKYERER
jgi:hypothetical protein